MGPKSKAKQTLKFKQIHEWAIFEIIKSTRIISTEQLR